MRKEPAHNVGDAGDAGSIPGSGRSPGSRSGNPLQYSCLENSMDKGARWATVHGVTKSQTWLSTWHCEYFLVICVLWRNVCLDLLSIFWLGCLGFLLLLISCISCLPILEIKPLSVTSFENIFSHSIDFLFILLLAYFSVQKFVNLIRSHLFYFYCLGRMT